MLRVGLTGGIAAGKSAVADMFGELGAPIVDTDVIAHELVAPGEPALDAIAAEFGPGVVARDGKLDRRALRHIVFGDPDRRRALEAILHPRIRARALAELDRAAGPYALVVVPLLLETDFHTLVDRILVVDCEEETQLERLKARDSIDAQAAQAILETQVDRATRLAHADDVIDNGGTREATRRQVEALHRAYLELAQGGLPK